MNIGLTIYKEQRTVFRLIDIALLTGLHDFNSLNSRLHYLVSTGALTNPRKGIYAKPGYDPEELAGAIFRPAYISLEYVLQRSGMLFQYDSGITVVSYLSRTVAVEERSFMFRKMKGEILTNPEGIIRKEKHVNIACAERAFLDLLWFEKSFYFDNLHPLNINRVKQLLPLYRSNKLTDTVHKLLQR